MARGVGSQLDRYDSDAVPEYCDNPNGYSNVLSAYNMLWIVVEANQVDSIDRGLVVNLRLRRVSTHIIRRFISPSRH